MTPNTTKKKAKNVELERSIGAAWKSVRVRCRMRSKAKDSSPTRRMLRSPWAYRRRLYTKRAGMK